MGGRCGDGLGGDVEGVGECGGDLLLEDRSAHGCEIIALAAVKRGRVNLDVLATFSRIIVPAATNDWLLVAGGAAHRVEQWTETGRGREYRREDRTACIEPQALRRAEPGQGAAEHRGDRRELGREGRNSEDRGRSGRWDFGARGSGNHRRAHQGGAAGTEHESSLRRGAR